jgi:hypothetical protein
MEQRIMNKEQILRIFQLEKLKKLPITNMKFLLPLLLTISLASFAQWGTAINSPVLWNQASTVSYSTLNTKFNIQSSNNGSSDVSILSNDGDLAGGFGFLRGANVASPMIWMYSGGNNAFTVASKNYVGGTGTPHGVGVLVDYMTPLFQVRGNGNIGIGTSSPAGALHVVGSGNNAWSYFSGNLNGAGAPQNLNGLAIGWNKSGSNGESIITYNTSAGSAPRLDFASYNGSSFSTEMSLQKGNLSVNGNLNLTAYGSVSSNRSSNNSYTNLFLGGGIVDQSNGTYQVMGDGANNYFAGIKMDETGGQAGIIKFYTRPSVGGANYTLSNADLESYVKMVIVNGNVGIGNANPDAKLAVSGNIHATEIKVSATVPGPDYVFEKNYSLPSLESVKTYIDQNKHLPEVPSAKEMEANGINLSEMNMLLLKKVEELTLYVIELKRGNEATKNELMNKINELEKKLNN